MSEVPEPEIRDNTAASRYELTVDGHVAFIAYEPMAGGRVFVHTEVPSALEGRGVGGRLVKGALLDMRSRGWKVQPDCTFVASYIERHPEFADLVAGA